MSNVIKLKKRIRQLSLYLQQRTAELDGIQNQLTQVNLQYEKQKKMLEEHSNQITNIEEKLVSELSSTFDPVSIQNTRAFIDEQYLQSKEMQDYSSSLELMNNDLSDQVKQLSLLIKALEKDKQTAFKALQDEMQQHQDQSNFELWMLGQLHKEAAQ